jgi:DNA modification methylase
MKIINSDCIEAMKQMADNSVDAIVTDPPYELGFMGKSWDSTGIAFNVEVWKEALRVLKPGANLIAFSGSRTYHRMAVAIEDAGFEIRDQIMWVYGSGFPKSMNIAKALDKTNGFQGEVIGTEKVDIGMQGGSMHSGRSTNVVEREITKLSDQAQKWEGWGTALKPAHEPMVLARKPLEGTVVNNVLTYGVGGLNIDGSRVEGKLEGDPNRFAKTDGGEFVMELHDAPIVRNEGRWPANFIHDGSDEVVALFPESKGMATQKSGSNINIYGGNALYESSTTFPDTRQGFNDSGSAARFFYCAKTSKADRNEGLDNFPTKQKIFNGQNDTSSDYVEGSVENKFTTQPSANHHPTVKPTELMRYLCKLITPPKGVILDPFMGSGSTGKGAVKEGFDFIGIDQSSEYCEIARARIEYALETLPEFEQEQLL